jgi:hypothetical protein
VGFAAGPFELQLCLYELPVAPVFRSHTKRRTKQAAVDFYFTEFCRSLRMMTNADATDYDTDRFRVE